MSKKKDERRKQIIRIITGISAIAFIGSSGSGLVRMLTSPERATQAATHAEDLTQRLQAQARGYETVLQREPENLTALENLVEIRLQMEDFERTIEPLETLVKLYPEQEQYKTLLTAMKQEVEQKGDGKGNDEAKSN